MERLLGFNAEVGKYILWSAKRGLQLASGGGQPSVVKSQNNVFSKPRLRQKRPVVYSKYIPTSEFLDILIVSTDLDTRLWGIQGVNQQIANFPLELAKATDGTLPSVSYRNGGEIYNRDTQGMLDSRTVLDAIQPLGANFWFLSEFHYSPDDFGPAPIYVQTPPERATSTSHTVQGLYFDRSILSEGFSLSSLPLQAPMSREESSSTFLGRSVPQDANIPSEYNTTVSDNNPNFLYHFSGLGYEAGNAMSSLYTQRQELGDLLLKIELFNQSLSQSSRYTRITIQSDVVVGQSLFAFNPNEYASNGTIGSTSIDRRSLRWTDMFGNERLYWGDTPETYGANYSETGQPDAAISFTYPAPPSETAILVGSSSYILKRGEDFYLVSETGETKLINSGVQTFGYSGDGQVLRVYQNEEVLFEERTPWFNTGGETLSYSGHGAALDFVRALPFVTLTGDFISFCDGDSKTAAVMTWRINTEDCSPVELKVGQLRPAPSTNQSIVSMSYWYRP